MPVSTKVSEVVDRVLRVPGSARRFTEDEPDLLRLHGIGDVLLTELLDLGLPHSGTGGHRRYDAFDLANIGLGLGLSCPHWAAMRWWSRALAKNEPDAEIVYVIGVRADCPEPGHPGECRFSTNPRSVAAAYPSDLVRQAPGSYTVDLHLTTRTRHFGAPFDTLIEPVLPLRFHLLPQPVAEDLGFLAATGLADCQLAARYLATLGAEQGLPVREAQGYFVMSPYPIGHAWAEFLVDDQWLAADPFLLNAFARWGLVDPRQWPPNRSLEGRLLRLADRRFDTITHGDTPLVPALAVIEERTVAGRGE